MADAKRKSRARIQQSALLPPNPEPNTLINRDEWIEQAAAGFITNSAANRGIYRVILETLWPKGHGIPGPIIDREDIRKAVDAAKGKPYIDTFRRVRELQGDEGFLGVVKQGNQYQLIDLNIYAKKTPRTHLSDDKWKLVLAQYKNVCAACGCPPGEGASSRIIRSLAHEAEPMRSTIGSPFAIRVTISKALLAVPAKRTVRSVVGHTPNFIDQSRFPAQFSAFSTNMQTSINWMLLSWWRT